MLSVSRAEQDRAVDKGYSCRNCGPPCTGYFFWNVCRG